MPSALQNRFIHVTVLPHFESFRNWALQNGVDEKIVAFLAWRPELLHKRDPKNPAWPSPRAWTAANALHLAGLPMDPAIGDAPAGEFRAYLKIYDTLPDFDSILAGKAKDTPFPAEPSARYAASLGRLSAPNRRIPSRTHSTGSPQMRTPSGSNSSSTPNSTPPVPTTPLASSQHTSPPTRKSKGSSTPTENCSATHEIIQLSSNPRAS